MNLSFQEYLSSIMTFLTEKLIFQKNSKTGFQNRKPDFGFKTENRISGFRLTSLINRDNWTKASTTPLSSNNNNNIQKIFWVLCLTLKKVSFEGASMNIS